MILESAYTTTFTWFPLNADGFHPLAPTEPEKNEEVRRKRKK